MKIIRHDNSDERNILIGVITDDLVCGKVASRWNGELFQSKWANIVAAWCVHYYRKYGHAPGRRVENLFRNWAGKGHKDEHTIQLLESFLSSLSGEYENQQEGRSSEFLLDQAGEHFAFVQMKRLEKELGDALEAGDVAKAQQKVLQAATKRVQLRADESVAFFNDKEEVKAAFSEQEMPESVVRYTGGLKEFFGADLALENFVAFVGRVGIGKTFWLTDLAYRALSQRHKVAFFQIGDMTRRQFERRLGVRVTSHPLRSANKDGSWPCRVQVPKSIKPRPGENPLLEYESRQFVSPINWKKVWKACCALIEHQVKSDTPYFRLSVHPARSVNILEIQDIINDWVLQDWVPEVVVIDYADLLAPVDMTETPRDRINTSWVLMRQLSQVLHCLLVTATQSDAESYRKNLLDLHNFTDDRRKWDHCTNAYAINQTDDEQELGVYRLQQMKRREDKTSTRRVVHVASCLALANPAVVSSY